jgi:hypothetical protein
MYTRVQNSRVELGLRGVEEWGRETEKVGNWDRLLSSREYLY